MHVKEVNAFGFVAHCGCILCWGKGAALRKASRAASGAVLLIFPACMDESLHLVLQQALAAIVQLLLSERLAVGSLNLVLAPPMASALVKSNINTQQGPLGVQQMSPEASSSTFLFRSVLLISRDSQPLKSRRFGTRTALAAEGRLLKKKMNDQPSKSLARRSARHALAQWVQRLRKT